MALSFVECGARADIGKPVTFLVAIDNLVEARQLCEALFLGGKSYLISMSGEADAATLGNQSNLQLLPHRFVVSPNSIAEENKQTNEKKQRFSKLNTKTSVLRLQSFLYLKIRILGQFFFFNNEINKEVK